MRATPAQTRRCYRMLESGGDVWAGLIELNAPRFARRGRPIFSFVELCSEVAGLQVGELSVPALRSVLKRYSDACFHTATTPRHRRGPQHRRPRRRNHDGPGRRHAPPGRSSTSST